MGIIAAKALINGRTYLIERDADTNALIRREPVRYESVGLKEQMERDMRSQASDLHDFNHVIEQAIARGEPGAAITELRALETELYNRFKATYLEWRVL